METRNNNLSTSLFDFAYCPKWEEQKRTLASFALPEKWGNDKEEFKILDSYINHTYKRLAVLENAAENKGRWISFTQETACFNTGLYTENYNRIFAVFYKNTTPDKQPYRLKGFFDESDNALMDFKILPNRASYFNTIDELLFNPNYELRVNLNHILNDEENLRRIPEEYRNSKNLRTLFNGALDMAKKRIAANYNIAVPQYYDGKLQLLIPISLNGDLTQTDLVLAVSRHDGVYIGRTCLTLEMAYNNARLIAKPEVPWINRLQ